MYSVSVYSVSVYACVHLCVCVCACVCVHACVCVCMCVCVTRLRREKAHFQLRFYCSFYPTLGTPTLSLPIQPNQHLNYRTHKTNKLSPSLSPPLTHTHAHTHAHTHTDTQTCTHTHMLTHTHAHTDIHSHMAYIPTGQMHTCRAQSTIGSPKTNCTVQTQPTSLLMLFH